MSLPANAILYYTLINVINKPAEITLLNELSNYLESPKGADDIIIQCDLIDKTKDFLNKYSQTINKIYDDLFRDEQYYDGEEH